MIQVLCGHSRGLWVAPKGVTAWQIFKVQPSSHCLPQPRLQDEAATVELCITEKTESTESEPEEKNLKLKIIRHIWWWYEMCACISALICFILQTEHAIDFQETWEKSIKIDHEGLKDPWPEWFSLPSLLFSYVIFFHFSICCALKIQNKRVNSENITFLKHEFAYYTSAFSFLLNPLTFKIQMRTTSITLEEMQISQKRGLRGKKRRSTKGDFIPNTDVKLVKHGHWDMFIHRVQSQNNLAKCFVWRFNILTWLFAVQTFFPVSVHCSGWLDSHSVFILSALIKIMRDSKRYLPSPSCSHYRSTSLWNWTGQSGSVVGLSRRVFHSSVNIWYQIDFCPTGELQSLGQLAFVQWSVKPGLLVATTASEKNQKSKGLN